MTKAAKEFITPLSVASLSENPVYDELFSLKNESEMEHIKLSREADIILICPASADIIGKMACGLANDLASSVLLAADKPIIIAPAMNIKMWKNKALQRNVNQLQEDGIKFIGPDSGELACGEFGEGRMAEIEEIFNVLNSSG